MSHMPKMSAPVTSHEQQPHTRAAHPMLKSGPLYISSRGEEFEGAGFGEETQHFFEESSDEDCRVSDIGETSNEGQLRMHADIVLERPQYSGIPSTRKVAFGVDKDAFVQSDKRGGSNQEIGHFWELDGEDNEANLQKMEDLVYGDADLEMGTLEREYEELQAQEEEMLHGLRGCSGKEISKRKAVRDQKALWEKGLEIRIFLQKPFSNANRLPLGDTRKAMCEYDDEVNKAYDKLIASSVETIGCLSKIIQTILNQNSSDENAELNDVSYSFEDIDCQTDALWQQLSSLYARFVPFRNSSIDRWQRKAQLSSGAAISKTKLKAFNQSISQQIESYMKDSSRILERMKLSQSSIDILGMPKQRYDSEGDGMSDLNATSKDPELIDDMEFYQELLREFLESSDPSSIRIYSTIRQLHNKKRKVVDWRASKGRKIRYNVHDKIVNFMVPIPIKMQQMAEKLLCNLFGNDTQR